MQTILWTKIWVQEMEHNIPWDAFQMVFMFKSKSSFSGKQQFTQRTLQPCSRVQWWLLTRNGDNKLTCSAPQARPYMVSSRVQRPTWILANDYIQLNVSTRHIQYSMQNLHGHLRLSFYFKDTLFRTSRCLQVPSITKLLADLGQA